MHGQDEYQCKRLPNIPDSLFFYLQHPVVSNRFCGAWDGYTSGGVQFKRGRMGLSVGLFEKNYPSVIWVFGLFIPSLIFL